MLGESQHGFECVKTKREKEKKRNYPHGPIFAPKRPIFVLTEIGDKTQKRGERGERGSASNVEPRGEGRRRRARSRGGDPNWNAPNSKI